ncbi:DUF3795 domain-containing protein [Desulfocucumis palustris]|uniref:DUF3795 domain-containing protein n=1 Tax=Desulfocucumis palustris TaxID=1898651 RepID=UPI000CE9C264|nr:DUF3795 domain-containing protein [Desulfocucumis palustris]
MDYKQITAPCGMDCFNCIGYLANEDPKWIPEIANTLNISVEQAEKAVCKGCRNQNGKIPFLPMECNVYPCIKRKSISFCYECHEFPCDHLHPYADQASKVPHNTKVFNLCLIKKLGLEAWAQEKAKSVREVYFTGNWKL